MNFTRKTKNLYRRTAQLLPCSSHSPASKCLRAKVLLLRILVFGIVQISYVHAQNNGEQQSMNVSGIVMIENLDAEFWVFEDHENFFQLSAGNLTVHCPNSQEVSGSLEMIGGSNLSDRFYPDYGGALVNLSGLGQGDYSLSFIISTKTYLFRLVIQN